MTDTIRIGIAGANAGARHAQAFASLPEAALVAIADPDATLREPLAETFGIERQFSSAEELIRSEGLDAVVIATPSYLHERHIDAVFEAGLHALCETPVAINSSEASRLVTAAGLVGKTFMTSCPLRFDPRISEARRLVQEGAIGEPFRADCQVNLAHWSHPPDSWRLDRERGGGALLEVGLEWIDLVWFAFGCPDPMEAMAARYDLFSKKHADEDFEAIAEDALAGMVRFKNGAALQVAVQIHRSSASGNDERSLRIWGSDGSIDLLEGLRSTPEGPTRFAAAVTDVTCYQAQAKAFLHSIRSKEEPLNTGKQALTLLKLADALLTSSREKEAVSIKVERSLDDLFGSL